MPIDPRTPVVVGVGQVVNRPAPAERSTWTEPVRLMADALRIAGEDAAPRSGSSSSLLERLDELTAIPSFVWRVNDPALAASRLAGATAARTRLAFPGGTLPQTLLFDAARRIAAGALDVVGIVGAEALRSRHLARSHHQPAAWLEQGDDVAAAPVVGSLPDALTAHEREVGLVIPVHAYALFEHALRRSRGQSRSEHLGALGALGARMSAVAAANPNAWLRDARSADEVATPSPANRMVSVPYTKLLASNPIVDMGAAILVCSLGAARAAGVPDERLVFPVAGATAFDQWFVSQRWDLSASLAMRACARGLFGDDPAGSGGPELMDLYSCFPVAVQMAGEALGIDVWRDHRAPTVTGGMTFFGGPGNNYVTHSLATVVESLRAAPGSTGLVTALGWYATTHAWGTYSTTPPAGGFRSLDVQADVDRWPLRVADDGYSGRGEVESYTVSHGRDGEPARAIVSVLTPTGARRLVSSDDARTAAALEEADPLGGPVVVEDGGVRLE